MPTKPSENSIVKASLQAKLQHTHYPSENSIDKASPLKKTPAQVQKSEM